MIRTAVLEGHSSKELFKLHKTGLKTRSEKKEAAKGEMVTAGSRQGKYWTRGRP